MSTGIFAKTLLGTITDVPVDARILESHGLTATPANFALENGSVVSDHVVLNPATLEIPYELNNQDLRVDGIDIGGGTNTSYGIKAALLFNLLTLNFESRTLYTIVTRHKLYLNMVMIELPAEHTAPDIGTLRGSVKFQQMNLPNIVTVEIPTDQLSPDGTQLKASSAVPAGTQALLDIDDTDSALQTNFNP